MSTQFQQLEAFWRQADENGITKLEKTKNAKVIRRIASTDKGKSFEESDTCAERMRSITAHRHIFTL